MCVDVDVCVQLRVSGRRTNIDHEVPGFFPFFFFRRSEQSSEQQYSVSSGAVTPSPPATQIVLGIVLMPSSFPGKTAVTHGGE